MFDDLLDGAPVLLDHLGHILGPFLEFVLDVLLLSFLLEFAFVELLLAGPAVLLGIARLLLGLPLEVLRHPLHLLH